MSAPAPAAPHFPELGYYGLPGHGTAPWELADDVRTGEALGLGSVWLSERFATKNVEVLAGIAAATSHTIGIASGLIANLPLRHPLVVAGFGSTMAAVSGGRFALGIGRGQPPMDAMAGLPAAKLTLLEDYVTILRRLWRGETVSYAGPLGTFTDLRLGARLDAPPPVIMASMGERTAAWAGRHCDGLLLYSWWTPDAIARFAAIARAAAAEAGRDPARFRVWTIQLTCCGEAEDTLDYVTARLNAVMGTPAMATALCRANGWSPAAADSARAAIAERGLAQRDWFAPADSAAQIAELRWTRALYPAEWFEHGAAAGSVAACTASMAARLDAGADGLLLHGGRPQAFATLLDGWAKCRPAARFAGRLGNPALSV